MALEASSASNCKGCLCIEILLVRLFEFEDMVNATKYKLQTSSIKLLPSAVMKSIQSCENISFSVK